MITDDARKAPAHRSPLLCKATHVISKSTKSSSGGEGGLGSHSKPRPDFPLFPHASGDGQEDPTGFPAKWAANGQRVLKKKLTVTDFGEGSSRDRSALAQNSQSSGWCFNTAASG